MAGFYLMHRGWMDNDALGGREPLCKRAAWVWLIEQAAWEDCTVTVKGQPVPLRRGQLAYSLRFLAEAWGWNLPSVQRYINRLKNDTMIDTATDTRLTVITICNYDEYQASPGFDDTDGDTVRDTQTDTPTDTKKNQENQKNQKKEDSLRTLAIGTAAPAPAPATVAPAAKPARAPAEQRATRLAADWQPVGEFATFARSGGLNPATVGAVFRDYWHAKGGKDGRKTDWLATWRNWCRRDRNWREPPTAGSQASLLDRPATAQREAPDARYPINPKTGRHFTASEWMQVAGELGL